MARHRLTPKDHTSTNSMFHLSAACREGGDGQCDGWLTASWGAADECNCACHSGRGHWGRITSIAQMEMAHAEKNRISLTPRRAYPAHRASVPEDLDNTFTDYQP